MKIRTAWKMWVNDDSSRRFPKALHTIEIRTRRYYRNLSRKAYKEEDNMMYKFYAHVAEWPYLMGDTLWKNDGQVKVGKSFHIW